MNIKLPFLVSVVLALSLGSTCYGLVIGNWEGSMDEWAATDPSIIPSGEPVFSYSSIGATLDANSLRVGVDIAGQTFVMILKLQNVDLTEEFFRHNIFSIDVTRIASEWTGSTGDSGLVLIVNSDDVWDGYGTAGLWNPTDGDSTMTLSWDYSESISKISDDAGFVEFILCTTYPEEYVTGGIFYVDNARLSGVGNYRAHEPNPEDGRTDLQRDPILTWEPGMGAVSHNLYIGTSYDEVNDANEAMHRNVTLVQPETNSYIPGILDFNKTYYWRVDEVNDPNVWKGLVWDFTIGYYLIVDDMEAYNGLNPDEEGSNRIFLAWVDGYEVTGNGSLVGNDIPPFVEQNNVHGGNQSMPFYYDNNLQYSEAKKTLSDQRDWAAEGVKALSIWFYGDPANAAEQMYVAVANSTGTPVIVNHPNPAAIQTAEWQEWNTDLKEFEDGGIDLTDVDSIAIGFGDKDNLVAGGTGTVLFDDVRLYPPRCILSKRTPEFAKLDFEPAGDPAGDCVIDYQEIEVMARDWLVEDEVTATASPGTSGLVGYYPMNEGAGTETADASGFNHRGTFTGGLTWISPGIMDSAYAINMDGSPGSKISIGTWNPATGTGEMTLALWIKWAGPRESIQGQPQGLICKRDQWNANQLMFILELDTPDTAATRGAIGLRQHTSGRTDVYTDTGAMDPYIGQWAHVAATFDGTTARIYINGWEAASGPFAFARGTSAGMTIGNNNSSSWDGCPGAFYGDVDEVRIYNRALTAAQVAYLADTTPADGELHSVPSKAEFLEIGDQSVIMVNFNDLAVLAQEWLSQMQWPFSD